MQPGLRMFSVNTSSTKAGINAITESASGINWLIIGCGVHVFFFVNFGTESRLNKKSLTGDAKMRIKRAGNYQPVLAISFLSRK